MALTKDKIEAMAPDQASLGAALKLLKPAAWPVLARDAPAVAADGALLWGECQGSGSTPYRVVVSPDDVGYKCTCPSRKFPCKHVLAVMWTFADKPERFVEGSPPDWVKDWQSRRRPKSPSALGASAKDAVANLAGAEEGAGKPAASMAQALDDAAVEVETPTDPKAIARAAAQRQRLLDEREASVRDGLDDLDRWLVDQLNLGLSGFQQRAAAATRDIAKRLVDAKAQGLATRLDALAADVFRVPEAIRADVILERFSTLALLTSAYRRRTAFSAPLVADLRRAVGWNVRREEVLVDPAAARVASGWTVAAVRGEVQPDKLRRLETWLVAAGDTAERAPRFALLVDFVPVSSGNAAPPFAPGETFDAEVVYYPSPAPLRAQLATRKPATGAIGWPAAPTGLEPALAAYDAALGQVPWLDAWPIAAGGVAVARSTGGRLVLTDSTGLALPLDTRQTEDLMPMLGLTDVSAAVVWDGRTATVLALATPHGIWHEGR